MTTLNVTIQNLSNETTIQIMNVDIYDVIELVEEMGSTFKIEFNEIDGIETKLEFYGNDENIGTLEDLFDQENEHITVLTHIANNNHITSLEEAFENGIGDNQYETAFDFEDLAEKLHYSDMLYLNIPEELENFIDWGKVGNNLKPYWYIINGIAINEA